MDSRQQDSVILVTGADGHIGREVCRSLKAAKRPILPVDVSPREDVVACNLLRRDEVARLFEQHAVSVVIHLAGILPGALHADPLAGADLNLGASIELIRQAAVRRVKRFVFASSMSAYGSAVRSQPVTENDPATPDDLYGGAKRAVELLGEEVAKQGAMEFVALRIARVVGPGIKKTSSPWRAQILEDPVTTETIRIPFSPEAKLSLVHVEDVARMFRLLVEIDVKHTVYNTPAETWEASALKQAVEEARPVRIELGGGQGGPTCDGSRFEREFGFEVRGLRERLAECAARL
jgi:nucleoside-diphosphate-sugar epimerase